MKTDLKAKLIRHFLSNKKNSGFTLIELLVVIIIIGILSAIALPSFLNQANKARQSEAQTYIGSINRAQQVEFLEENEFGADLDVLEIGIPAATEDYAYATGEDITALGEDATVTSTADPTADTVKGYRGRVFVQTSGDGNATTSAVLCEGDLGTAGLPDVSAVESNAGCPE